MRLWDLATGQLLGPPLSGHTGAVWSVAFSPDGSLLATASSDNTVRLWGVATGRQHGDPLEGHTNTVTGVAFSPNGSVLASTSSDATVRLWEVASGKPHGYPLVGHAGPVWAVAFSANGDALATAGEDRTPRVWDWQFSSWVATGCGLLNRNLSLAEWKHSAGDLPYERTCPDLPPGPGAPADAPPAHYEP